MRPEQIDADDLRLARSEAEAARRLAVAMRSQGNPGATSEQFAAGTIVALGTGRFINRAMCTERSLTPDALTGIIDFFESRALAPSVQVPGWIDDSTTDQLVARGFTPSWRRSLLASPVHLAKPGPRLSDRATLGVSFVDVTDESLATWLRVLADGNETPSSNRPTSDEFGRAAHAVAGSTDVLAYVGTEAVACGSLQIVDGVGWLGGAATRPSARRRGVQAALLEHRIVAAADLGAQWVAATALPSSVSERNLQRAGLVRVDIQTVWTSSVSRRA